MPLIPETNCIPCGGVHDYLTDNPGPPGEQGPSGSNGTDGLAGVNAYTTTTAQFQQPAAAATVDVSVGNAQWIAQGQTLFMSVGGFYVATSINYSTNIVTLRNLGYASNAVPTTIIASDQVLSPSGPQGDQGTLTGAAGGVLTGNYPNPGLASTGITPGTYAKATYTADGRATAGLSLLATDIPNLPASQITSGTLPVTLGGTGASTSTTAFSALSPLNTAGDLIIENATPAPDRLAIGPHDSTLRVNALTLLPEWRATSYDLLGFNASVNANSTADNPIPIWSSKYVIDFIVAYNATVSLTTAVGGVYTAASKGGSALVAASQSYTALSTSQNFLNLTLATAATTLVRTESTIYLSLTTAQGAASTFTVAVFGRNLP